MSILSHIHIRVFLYLKVKKKTLITNRIFPDSQSINTHIHTFKSSWKIELKLRYILIEIKKKKRLVYLKGRVTEEQSRNCSLVFLGLHEEANPDFAREKFTL